MRIIGPASAERATVVAALNVLPNTDVRFLRDMFPHLWDAGWYYGIDPVGVVAQSWKETAGGRFTGRVKPQHYNTCGLKVRHPELYPEVTSGDLPLAHAMFPSWEVGAVAHVQHLRAYAGWPVDDDLVVDPRYVYVNKRYACENFEELGGKWAPSLRYGLELVELTWRLKKTT